MIQRVGSCGETRERTAARIHGYAAIVMSLCTAVEIVAVGLHVIMGIWHWASVGTHNQRAEEDGE